MLDVGLVSRVRRSGPYIVVDLKIDNNWQTPPTGLGVAKCHPNDKFDWRIGRDVAYARALRNIADKLENKALEWTER